MHGHPTPHSSVQFLFLVAILHAPQVVGQLPVTTHSPQTPPAGQYAGIVVVVGSAVVVVDVDVEVVVDLVVVLGAVPGHVILST